MKDFELVLKENMSNINKICSHYAFKFYLDKDDIKSIVLEKLWKNKDNYQERGFKFSSWIQTITRNTCLDIIKLKKVSLYSLNEDYNSVFEDHKVYEVRNSLYHTYKKIRLNYAGEKFYKYRITIYMTAKGYKIKEIADKLETAEGTVKVMLHRIRKFLKNG